MQTTPSFRRMAKPSHTLMTPRIGLGGISSLEVLAALPDFTRRVLEKESAALPDLKNSDPIPAFDLRISYTRRAMCARPAEHEL